MDQATSATQRALPVPELLESILSHVSQIQLFPLQRVSRSWHELINTSIKLQRLMFLANSPKAVKYTTVWLNPSFLHMVKPAFVSVGLDSLTETPTRAWAHSQATWRRMLLFTPGSD
ncbi:hypothetical protein LTR85_001521 [Meristemomyces frigidus]|nr:hypothetical protein LTR85_001521 [Meristemomyces frigidus]